MKLTCDLERQIADIRRRRYRPLPDFRSRYNVPRNRTRLVKTAGKQLIIFRPGEEHRMLARCQFGAKDGACGATFTYPIKGMPWRRNVVKSFWFDISADQIDLLFAEISRIKSEHPEECLLPSDVCSDASEKANGITRDRATGKLCFTLGIFVATGKPELQYCLREDAPALLQSALFKMFSELVAPHETL
jgi:hypothetical protein